MKTINMSSQQIYMNMQSILTPRQTVNFSRVKNAKAIILYITSFF